MKQQYKSFMGQFQAARKEVADMRTWMGESAKVATLTFPVVKPTNEANQRPAPTPKKRA